MARGHWFKLAMFTLFLPGCASSGRLHEFDFRGTGLAVVTIAPPRPEVFTGGLYHPENEDWIGTLMRVGTEVARDAQAEKARERLSQASEEVDVAALMADRVLVRSAGLLRARPVESVEEADFELEVRVNEYGIQADSWEARADFFIRGEVLLLESRSGEEIWRGEVEARDPVNPSGWELGIPMGNLMTAQALASLSVEEMKGALGELAVYSADRITEEFQEAVDRARR
jgi:hypothetical protein